MKPFAPALRSAAAQERQITGEEAILQALQNGRTQPQIEAWPQIKQGRNVLIAGAQELWATLPDIEDEQKRLEANRYTFRLVHLADILAVTTSTE